MKKILPLFLITVMSVGYLSAAPINNAAPTTSNGGVGTISSTFAGNPANAANITVITEANLENGDPAVPDNTVNMNMTYNSYGTMTATYTTAATTAPPNDSKRHVYRFNLNVTNNFTRDITGFHISLNPGTGSTQFFSDDQGNFGGAAVYNATGFNGAFSGGIHFVDANNIVYGGLAGGGSGITANGGSSVISFILYSNAGGAGNFTLSFTANPEPTSLALAGAAIAGFGGVVARRRRQKKAE